MLIFVIFATHISLNDTSEIKESESVETLKEKYENVSNLVVSYIVYASVNVNGKTLIGQVIEDKGNGTTYLININDDLTWFDSNKVKILENNNQLKLTDLTDEQIQFYVNYNSFKSDTDYFIWVDIYRNQTYILKKENNYFVMLDRFMCSTGSNTTPTKRGLFKISAKGESFLGRDKTYKCYYYLCYDGSYLLHSFPYNLDDSVKDDRLNQRVSNGCVRFSLNDSKYIYNLIPINTTIWLN